MTLEETRVTFSIMQMNLFFFQRLARCKSSHVGQWAWKTFAACPTSESMIKLSTIETVEELGPL